MKNGLSYLSWPYAWSEVKKRFPDASYKVYETESGCIYFTNGCMAALAESRTKFGENNDTNFSRLYSDKEKSLERRNKPTFADCTAFGGIAKRILSEYKPKDEIWLIAKYYSKQQDGKYYKGFIVREIITEQEIQRGARAGNSRLKYSEECSVSARENSNFKTFDDLLF